MQLRIRDVCLRKRLKRKGKRYFKASHVILLVRAASIQNEVITSHKKNVDIDWRWQDLEEKEDCEELAKVRLHLIVSGLSYNCLMNIGNRVPKGGLHSDYHTEGRFDPSIP